MAFRLSSPLALPGSEHLRDASPRARELQARLIDQLETELATNPDLTSTDLLDALHGTRLWFAEEREHEPSLL